MAYIYERIISIICFIARTDVINMENHKDETWHVRTRYFISKKENKRIKDKKDILLEKIENNLYEGRRWLIKFADRAQLKLVKAVHELTKKPVLAFTIQDESDTNLMENLYIVNYIADFSHLGVEKYVEKIREMSEN